MLQLRIMFLCMWQKLGIQKFSGFCMPIANIESSMFHNLKIHHFLPPILLLDSLKIYFGFITITTKKWKNLQWRHSKILLLTEYLALAMQYANLLFWELFLYQKKRNSIFTTTAGVCVPERRRRENIFNK